MAHEKVVITNTPQKFVAERLPSEDQSLCVGTPDEVCRHNAEVRLSSRYDHHIKLCSQHWREFQETVDATILEWFA